MPTIKGACPLCGQPATLDVPDGAENSGAHPICAGCSVDDRERAQKWAVVNVWAIGRALGYEPLDERFAGLQCRYLGFTPEQAVAHRAIVGTLLERGTISEEHPADPRVETVIHHRGRSIDQAGSN